MSLGVLLVFFQGLSLEKSISRAGFDGEALLQERGVSAGSNTMREMTYQVGYCGGRSVSFTGHFLRG